MKGFVFRLGCKELRSPHDEINYLLQISISLSPSLPIFLPPLSLPPPPPPLSIPPLSLSPPSDTQSVVVSYNEDVEVGRCVSKMLQLQCTWAWEVSAVTSTYTSSNLSINKMFARWLRESSWSQLNGNHSHFHIHQQ